MVSEREPKAAPRRRLLDAAAELFSTKGYAETSLRDIAGAVGIKAGSVYYHFRSKDELYTEVLDAGMDLMIDGFTEVASGLDPTSPEPRSRLRSHVFGHLDVLHSNLAYTSLHVTTFRTAPQPVRSVVVLRRDAYEAMWTGLLSDSLPETPAAEITILRLALFGAMNSSIDWFDADQGSLKEFADVITDAFWAGATERVERAA